VRAMSHRGAWESHAQGEAVQVDGLARGSARYVRLLNRRKVATGEPCDAETVTHGSERGGGKRAARAVPRQPPILLGTSVLNNKILTAFKIVLVSTYCKLMRPFSTFCNFISPNRQKTLLLPL